METAPTGCTLPSASHLLGLGEFTQALDFIINRDCSPQTMQHRGQVRKKLGSTPLKNKKPERVTEDRLQVPCRQDFTGGLPRHAGLFDLSVLPVLNSSGTAGLIQMLSLHSGRNRLTEVNRLAKSHIQRMLLLVSVINFDTLGLA